MYRMKQWIRCAAVAAGLCLAAAASVYADDEASIVNQDKIQNFAMQNVEQNRQRSLDYENGQAVTFTDDQDLWEWEEYYSRNYRLWDEEIWGVEAVQGPQQRTVRWRAQNTGKAYDREALRNQVLQIYGEPAGSNSREKVYDAMERLRERVIYDGTVQFASLKYAVQSGKMVCWQMARCMKILLEEAGVQSEILVVYDKRAQGDHTLIRWKEEGEWRYIDPSHVIDAGDEKEAAQYYDIPVEKFQEWYEVIKSCRVPKR